MQLRQLLTRAIIMTVFGLGLIGIAVASELLSVSRDGIGPYQAILIILGILIIVLGLLPTEHVMSKLVLLCLSFVVSIILVEGLLMILSRANVVVTFPDTRELLDDDLLGKRTPPDAPGHDARGWRNTMAVDHADIVVIGDSQTWGVNATQAESYPAVLSELSGYDVYSMAQGSYGAVQYHVLAERAVDLSPQLVVIGMYFGNDFVDAYSIVYGDYAHKDLRDPQVDLSAISQTIEERASALQPESPQNQNQQSTKANTADLTFWERIQSATYIGKFLTRMGVFDAIDTGEAQEQLIQYREIVSESPELYAMYQQGDVETFFTPAYRQLVVDTDSKIIQEGIRISKIEYTNIHDLLNKSQIDLLVVLIPTKEFVYTPYLVDDALNNAYKLLVEQETQIRDDMRDFFETNDIAYVDTLSALQQAVEDGIPIYPSTFDGHPIANGYHIIAEVIASYIDEHKMMK